MDARSSRKTGSGVRGYKGYSGYGSEPEGGQDTSLVRKSLERDLILEEYREDREAILSALKTAIRERQYQEAQEFVYKYRAAAREDESFAVLAQMTADGLKTDKALEKLQVSLDATPEYDYRVRLSICERMYRMRMDEKILEQVNGYRAKLNMPLMQSDGTEPAPPTVAERIPQAARKVADVILAMMCGIMVAVALLFGTVALVAGDGHGGIAFCLALVEIALHCATMLPRRGRIADAMSYTFRYTGNILFFLVMFVIICVVGF